MIIVILQVIFTRLKALQKTSNQNIGLLLKYNKYDAFFCANFAIFDCSSYLLLINISALFYCKRKKKEEMCKLAALK